MISDQAGAFYNPENLYALTMAFVLFVLKNMSEAAVSC